MGKKGQRAALDLLTNRVDWLAAINLPLKHQKSPWMTSHWKSRWTKLIQSHWTLKALHDSKHDKGIRLLPSKILLKHTTSLSACRKCHRIGWKFVRGRLPHHSFLRQETTEKWASIRIIYQYRAWGESGAMMCHAELCLNRVRFCTSQKIGVCGSEQLSVCWRNPCEQSLACAAAQWMTTDCLYFLFCTLRCLSQFSMEKPCAVQKIYNIFV